MLIILLYGLLQFSGVQTFVVQSLAKEMSKQLKTEVSIKKVKLRFLNKLELEGLLVKDLKKDTLLYAGTAKGDVTDWFIFKDKIAIKNLQLDNALVNMNRSDSVWNYQFLIDFFASPTQSGKAKKNIDISLNELHFNNIHFNKIDKWVGQDMKASLHKMDLTVDSVNFYTGQIYINKLLLDNPVFSQYGYKGNRPPKADLSDVLEKIPVVSAFKWNNSGWILSAKNVKIIEGSFINDKFTERVPFDKRFDGQHIHFSRLNGDFNNILFLNDTLRANVNFTANERSGLQVKKFKSDIKFTPELMEFANLDLQTNKSTLKNYFSMEYKAFSDDMSNFLSNVLMTANFENSTVYSDDIAIFAPALKTWKRKFELEGKAKGTVDNFVTENMQIRTGNSFINGNLTMRGLPDIKTTFIDFRSKGSTINYNDLSAFIPSLKNVKGVNLKGLSPVYFKGNFTGFTDDFVVFGDLKTSLGNAALDLNLKFPAGQDPVYKGYINTPGFNLGRFTGNSQFGMVAAKGHVDGRGFDINTLSTKFNGYVQRFDYNNYSYRDIALDVNLSDRLLKGKIQSNDPNIQLDDFYTEIYLGGKGEGINLNAKVKSIDLKNLGITKQPIKISGLFNLNFTGKTIDDFLGTALIKDAVVYADNKRLEFDSLLLVSQQVADKKILNLRSNEFNILLSGKFTVRELPDAFKYFLSNYYPSYIKKPAVGLQDQNFTFQLDTKNVGELLSIFVPAIEGLDGAEIDGSLNLARNELLLNAQVPDLRIKGKRLENATINATGDVEKLHTDVVADNIIISDSLYFPDTKLEVVSHNDSSEVHLVTSANKTLNRAALNADVITRPEGVDILFFPSTFVINEKTWSLEKAGTLVIRKNEVAADRIVFSSDQQRVALFTDLDELTNENNLNVHVQNLILDDIIPFFLKNPSLKGKLNGTAILKKPFGKMEADFAGYADSFKLNDRLVGRVNLATVVNTNTGMITFNGNSEDEYAFTMNGNYNMKDSGANPLYVALNSENFNLNIIEPFLSAIASKLTGVAKANLELRGGKARKSLTGRVLVKNADIKIAYTQVPYHVENQAIEFGDGYLDVGNMRIEDTLGNSGTLTGRMYHNFFDELRISNVHLETQKMILLNTTRKDNDAFYGYAIGRGRMDVNGPLTNLVMNIEGEPSILDTSRITIPSGEARETSTVNYIDFIQFGREMTTPKAPNTTNILVNLSLIANPACEINMILDEETGDIIKAQGNGNLAVSVGTTEPLSMRGRYELTKGEYTFNFQTFLKKPFTLRRGSITWNGDPYQAILDIDAEYLAKNVDMSSLTAGSGYYQKEDITILSHISGFLTKPEISFQFKLPEKSDLNRDYIITKRLDDFRNDENAMNKQVASLLLFNSFMVENTNFFSQDNTLALATNTIGGVVSSWITTMLNKELERATNGVISTYVDINPTFSVQNTARELQANVRMGMKILLSSRINLLLGGNLDYNNPYIIDRRSIFTPDITIEWVLNRDGTLRVIGFNRSSIDLTAGQRNRSGVQLSYRKDFDRLSDIFKSKKKVQEEALRNESIRVTPLN